MVLWYQGMSRVVPEQCRSGKGMQRAILSIANAYVSQPQATPFRPSSQVHAKGIRGAWEAWDAWNSVYRLSSAKRCAANDVQCNYHDEVQHDRFPMHPASRLLSFRGPVQFLA